MKAKQDQREAPSDRKNKYRQDSYKQESNRQVTTRKLVKRNQPLLTDL